MVVKLVGGHFDGTIIELPPEVEVGLGTATGVGLPGPDGDYGYFPRERLIKSVFCFGNPIDLAVAVKAGKRNDGTYDGEWFFDGMVDDVSCFPLPETQEPAPLSMADLEKIWDGTTQ
jgi:hypothetical protein